MITIREATPEDAGLILYYVKELAKYEKAETAVVATEATIRDSIFQEGSTTKALICLLQDRPIGFAVYFHNYSTWLGKQGIYLEDLYISPEYRKSGAGKAILKHIARLAVEKNCGRFEWAVLDWNEPAIRFYRKIGAQPQDEWVIYRLAGEKLLEFAAG